MMTLDHNTQRERLNEALMDAFPSYEHLKRMADYKLNIKLEACTGSRKLADCVFDLIEHMRAHGRLEDLVRGACQQNPGNQQLRAFAKDHHVITSDLTLSLPELDLTAFGTAPTTNKRPKNELFSSEQVKLRMQPSDYYREEMSLGPADARRFGIPAGGQYALLQLQQFTLNEHHHAVRLVIDPRLEQGVMACNQHFMAELRLDDSQPPQWSVLSSQRIVPLQECVLELALERGNLERDLETLQRRRDQILLNRALFFGQGQSIQSLSLRADGWGYFNLRSISPDLSRIAPDSILTFDEHTNFQLFASHSKSGVDMVIVVDGSGSMDTSDYLGANNSRLTRLKGVCLAIEALIQRRLLAGTRVSRLAFVVFGQNATMLYPSPQETMIEIKNEKQIKEMRDNLARKLTRLGLEDLKIDRGYSEIPRALSYAADLLDYCHTQGNEKILMLLSDGANNWKESADSSWHGEMVSPTTDPAMLADTLRETSGIRIHTVAISSEQAYRSYTQATGTKMHPGHIPNVPLLRKIAQSTGGIFFESPDARVLTRLFDEIGEGVTYPLSRLLLQAAGTANVQR